MGKAWTNEKRPGNKKSTPIKTVSAPVGAVDHALVLIETVCLIAGSEHLIRDPSDETTQQLQVAIAGHDTAHLFERLLEAFSFQGISDQVALTYMDQHGRVRWQDIERSLKAPTGCPKLESYWKLHCCGFEKGSRTCSEPSHFADCPLPRHDLRNGRLNQTAYSLFLFVRDVADGDLVGWIDARLRKASSGAVIGRLARMREALIGPLRNIYGISDKVLSMALSDLLIAAPRTKQYWFETGVSMIVIDTLVHNFFHRTGILERNNSEHAYGSACYQPGGCADIIERAAKEIDARQCSRFYPQTFSRWAQHAIWSFCAQDGLDICNGNKIDDCRRCRNVGCLLFDLCDRVALMI